MKCEFAIFHSYIIQGLNDSLMADGHPVYTQSQSNIYYQTARVSAKVLSNSSVIKYEISQTEEITFCKPVYIVF